MTLSHFSQYSKDFMRHRRIFLLVTICQGQGGSELDPTTKRKDGRFSADCASVPRIQMEKSPPPPPPHTFEEQKLSLLRSEGRLSGWR